LNTTQSPLFHIYANKYSVLFLKRGERETVHILPLPVFVKESSRLSRLIDRISDVLVFRNNDSSYYSMVFVSIVILPF
jgi:hypothetical protein